MLYFYQTFQISSQSIDEARTELSMYMTGSDVSDMCAFELLHSLGVRWNQIRILLDAFPTLTCCDTDPGWELLDHGNVRSKLKVKTLIYLRKRLQITNSDIHAMMKVRASYLVLKYKFLWSDGFHTPIFLQLEDAFSTKFVRYQE